MEAELQSIMQGIEIGGNQPSASNAMGPQSSQPASQQPAAVQQNANQLKALEAALKSLPATASVAKQAIEAEITALKKQLELSKPLPERLFSARKALEQVDSKLVAGREFAIRVSSAIAALEETRSVIMEDITSAQIQMAGQIQPNSLINLQSGMLQILAQLESSGMSPQVVTNARQQMESLFQDSKAALASTQPRPPPPPPPPPQPCSVQTHQMFGQGGVASGPPAGSCEGIPLTQPYRGGSVTPNSSQIPNGTICGASQSALLHAASVSLAQQHLGAQNSLLADQAAEIQQLQQTHANHLQQLQGSQSQAQQNQAAALAGAVAAGSTIIAVPSSPLDTGGAGTPIRGRSRSPYGAQESYMGEHDPAIFNLGWPASQPSSLEPSNGLGGAA